MSPPLVLLALTLQFRNIGVQDALLFTTFPKLPCLGAEKSQNFLKD